MTDITGNSEVQLLHMSGSVRRSQHSAQHFSGSHLDDGLPGATPYNGGRIGGTNTRQRRRHRPGGNQLLHMLHEGGTGSGEQPSHLQPPPPPPWPPPNDSLKNLLAQVAPQARIIENTSRLTSRASAQILSRVLSEAIPGTPAWGSDEPPVHPSGSELDTTTSNSIGSASTHAGAASSGSRVTGNSGNSTSTSASSGPSKVSYGGSRAGIPEEEEEDDRQFMAKWQALFNRGSPLLDGTAADPFKEDLRRRGPPKWKKNSERPGHHSRYQQRRQKRDIVSQEEGTTEAGEAASGSTCEAVDLVFDASREEPETVPSEKTSLE